MAVHTEDTAVTVGSRPTKQSERQTESDGEQERRALTVLGVQGGEVVLPEHVYDVNGQQLDTRRENSWLLKLGEVETVEAAEVSLPLSPPPPRPPNPPSLPLSPADCVSAGLRD